MTFAILALFATGCSSSKKPEPEAKEIKPSDKGVSIKADSSEQDLFKDAKRLYEQGLYNVSRESFEAIRNQYPVGPYVDFAEIKIGDTYFYGGQYKEAATQYEEYAKNHPQAAANPYVLMMAGRSYSKAQRGVGRDMAPLEKALEIYDRTLAKYPNSIYAYSIPALRAEVVETITENQKIIRDYYAKKNKTKAVEARSKIIDEKWSPLLNSSKEAAQVSLPPSEAPEGVKIQEAKIVTPQAPAPKIELVSSPTTSKTLKTGPSERFSPGTLPAGARYVVQVSCQSDGSKLLFLELSSEPTTQDLQGLETLKAVNGDITFTLKNTKAREQVIDCFAPNDLAITSDGKITIKGQVQASALALSNPPRVAVVF